MGYRVLRFNLAYDLIKIFWLLAELFILIFVSLYGIHKEVGCWDRENKIKSNQIKKES